MATTEEAIIELPSATHIASFFMGYDVFLDWDHDGIAEWVDGKVYLYMSTTFEHQRVVDFLNRLVGLFVRFFKIGMLTTAPYAMRAISNGAGREPDLVFVSAGNLARVTSRQLEGPADLIIEVISDDSVTRDRTVKFAEYQEAGVREYWIIDPRPEHLRADFYLLDNQGSYEAMPVSDDHIYHSTVLPNFWLKIDWLWEEDPNVLAALAQVVGPDAMIAALNAPKE